jgi:hypothetical protein
VLVVESQEVLQMWNALYAGHVQRCIALHILLAQQRL